MCVQRFIIMERRSILSHARELNEERYASGIPFVVPFIAFVVQQIVCSYIFKCAAQLLCIHPVIRLGNFSVKSYSLLLLLYLLLRI